MTRPRHQSKVGERGVDFSCPRCHVAGVKNSIPVWGRTESGYICGKEKPWEVASRDDPARRCQESLISRQDGVVQTGRIQIMATDTLLQRARTGTKAPLHHSGQWTASATASVNLTTHARNMQTLATHASDRTCQKWFERFKSNNFDLEDEERPGALLKFEAE
ncbi:SETMAR [Cordylochernes scorpioides]|uniref:SETMAR n=1 Tax=Cordylochernes scorpioides TaxID=51811 RepID=A0ABY6L4X9_9ARAC|nr:SETMAR [Cordylochernes scorpioides]